MTTPTLLEDDGRTVIVALDHALASGQVAPLDRPEALLREVLGGQPDGLILSRGMHGLVGGSFGGKRWLTADYYATSTLPGAPGNDEIQDLIWDARAAKRAGADGLKALLVFGRADPEVHRRNVTYLARLVSDAAEAGLGVMIEAVLWGSRIDAGLEADDTLVSNAARIAFELGATVVKIPIPQTPAAMERLASSLPVPIILMGGPASDPVHLFAALRDAIDAGAKGVALGRNVWQHTNPSAMTMALRALVHDGATPAEAIERLGGAGGGPQ